MIKQLCGMKGKFEKDSVSELLLRPSYKYLLILEKQLVCRSSQKVLMNLV